MFRSNVKFVVSSLLALLLVAGALAQKSGQRSGFDKANLDESCAACDDFYQYANGGWMKNHPRPAAFSRWGSFSILAERNLEVAHKILEEAAADKKASAGSNTRKIGDLYSSCMDTARIESEGLQPISGRMNQIAAINDVSGLQATVARLHRQGVSAMFNFSSTPDYKDTTVNIAVAGQGGLTLPDRSYYTDDDPKLKATREEYVKHVTKMFTLAGDAPDGAAAAAQAVMNLETQLAKNSLTRVERRDPVKNYNKMSLTDLSAMNQKFSWTQYFNDAGRPDIKFVNVAQPIFFKGLDGLLASISINDWKTYLRWKVLNNAATFLPAKFDEENFNFFRKYLSGTTEQLPRWRRCVQVVDGTLGDALGEEYVKRNFTPQAKARMSQMIQNMIAALRTDLGTINWMGDATRKQALEKLEAFFPKIGYPDKWRDYSTLKIDRESLLANLARAEEFDSKRRMSDIGSPVDRSRWGMTPPTVNAYYSPPQNEIVFPAGILQPPFFDLTADDAINYGGIAAVIGHEMSHGFDDQGRQFDAKGLLRDWWTKEDADNYNERADCVVEQFNGFEVAPGLFQNGKLVLGESIGDLGGLKLAYLAYQKSLNGKEAPVIDGFTGDQRFFLGWAQVWATNSTPEAEALQARNDPHPLGRFRVNGPLSNMPEFTAAFGCKTGQKMVREKKCVIW